jgi:hypothetical protein
LSDAVVATAVVAEAVLAAAHFPSFLFAKLVSCPSPFPSFVSFYYLTFQRFIFLVLEIPKPGIEGLKECWCIGNQLLVCSLQVGLCVCVCAIWFFCFGFLRLKLLLGFCLLFVVYYFLLSNFVALLHF